MPPSHLTAPTMPRHADHLIAPQFLGRWSTRALRPRVTEAELLSCKPWGHDFLLPQP
jgi:hypothetical protein